MTRNEFHLWMNTQLWAGLMPSQIMAMSYHVDMSLGERLELSAHMDNILHVFGDEAAAAMAGCMFILGVTSRSIEDDWS